MPKPQPVTGTGNPKPQRKHHQRAGLQKLLPSAFQGMARKGDRTEAADYD